MVYTLKSGNFKQFLSFSKSFLWLDSHIKIKKQAFFFVCQYLYLGVPLRVGLSVAILFVRFAHKKYFHFNP